MTEYKERPSGGKQLKHHWNSLKRQRTISLTDAGWNKLSAIAWASETNRSEILEILIRYSQEKSLDLIEFREEMLPN